MKVDVGDSRLGAAANRRGGFDRCDGFDATLERESLFLSLGEKAMKPDALQLYIQESPLAPTRGPTSDEPGACARGIMRHRQDFTHEFLSVSRFRALIPEKRCESRCG